MPEPEAPHFDYPFRLNASGREARVVEQDSDDDTMNRTEVLLSTMEGERQESPDYGIPDQAFRENGADLELLAAQVAEWEDIQIRPESTEFTNMVQRVRVAVRGRDT